MSIEIVNFTSDNRIISEVELHKKWDQFVLHQPNSRAFQLYGWKNVLSKATSVTTEYLGVYDNKNGRFLAVLPAYISKGVFRSRILETLPGGILAEEHEYLELLADRIFTYSSEQRIRKIFIKGNEQKSFKNFTLISDTEHVHSWIDLKIGRDKLWSKIHKKHRYHVRKAEKYGFNVEMMYSIPVEFYPVFMDHQHRLGTPAHGWEYFDAINSSLGKYIRFFAVYEGTNLVAGAIMFALPNHWESLYVAASEKARRNHCINLLYWRIFESMIKRNIRWIDLGRSRKNSGNHIYKTRWNATDELINYKMMDRRVVTKEKEMKILRTHLSLMESSLPILWRNIPSFIVRIIGPMMRRNIPIG